MDAMVYLKGMLHDKQIASVMPTSSFGVKAVCSKIDFSRKNVIVEYGPGTGVFTQYLLEHLTPDSVLILIERNEIFAHILENNFNDSRLFIFYESAENIEQVVRRCWASEVDYIVSGIPFSFLPHSLRSAVVCNSHKCLRVGGKFLAYQMFFQMNHFLKNYLDLSFSEVETEVCLLNAPPLRIFEATK